MFNRCHYAIAPLGVTEVEVEAVRQHHLRSYASAAPHQVASPHHHLRTYTSEASRHSPRTSTQFTGFTGTKVQIVTREERRCRQAVLRLCCCCLLAVTDLEMIRVTGSLAPQLLLQVLQLLYCRFYYSFRPMTRVQCALHTRNNKSRRCAL
jgi:hypothetical protein